MSDHSTPDRFSSEQLVISRWRDPLTERVGHDVLGDYVEFFWLGVLGPSATWLVRRLAVIAVAHPDGRSVDLATLASSLGIGGDSTRANAFTRALRRLVMFGLARRVDTRLEVRTVVPPLSMRHLARLPEHLQRAHALWNEGNNSTALALAHGLDPTVENDDDSVSASAW